MHTFFKYGTIIKIPLCNHFLKYPFSFSHDDITYLNFLQRVWEDNSSTSIEYPLYGMVTVAESNKRMCIYCWIAFKFMHITYCYVYVFWRWNWSNRNLVYNYISASHDVRPKFHLLMGLTPEKGFRISVVRSIRKIACQSCKNSSPGQRLYFALVHGIQYFERNYSAQGRNCTVCNHFFIPFINKSHIFVLFGWINCKK